MATKLSDFLGHTVNVPNTFPTDVTFASGVKETKETLSGTSVNLDPSTGTIKLHTLTGNTTYTETLRSGEYVTLVIQSAGYTVTWPTITWTNNGGAAPDLTISFGVFITIWKVGGVLYGSLIGSLPDSYVSLLLNMDGVAGSTTFTDQSYYDTAMTAYGSAQISLFSKYGTGSLALNGVNGTYLGQTTTSENMGVGTDDFTAEAWIYLNENSGLKYYTIFYVWGITGNTIRLRFADSGFQNKIQIVDGGALADAVAYTPDKSFFYQTWRHVALVVHNGAYRLFIDGVEYTYTLGTAADGTPSPTRDIGSSGYVTIGGYETSNFNGYIDDFRFTKGVALYTSNFTPPTEPLSIYV